MRNAVSFMILAATLLSSFAQGADQSFYSKFCVTYLDETAVDCESENRSGYPGAVCKLEIEVMDRETGQIETAQLWRQSHANFGAGVFNLLGVGLLLDGPLYLQHNAKAKARLNAEIRLAKRHMCE